jgi:hypothetical protein
MAQVVLVEDGFRVDATLVAEAMRVTPQAVLEGIRAGQITTICERGVDEDAGRFPLTFLCGAHHLRLLVDPRGNVLERSVTTVRTRRGARRVREPSAAPSKERRR